MKNKTFTLTLSGVIKYDWSDQFEKIYLEQESGLNIDLVARFQELMFSFSGQCSVRHWITDKKESDEKIKECAIINILGGNLTAEYDANAYMYSEYTSGVDYDTSLTIGGHDVLSILKRNKGKYCLFEVEIGN